MNRLFPIRRAQHSRRGSAKSLLSASRGIVEVLEQRVLLATNPIVLENQLPGSPWDEWYINGAGDLSIQGFATDISVDQGDTVQFKIDNKEAAPYRLDVFRMGYYNGDGARKVATMYSTPATQIAQPAPLYFEETGTTDAGNWSVTDSWTVPETATSGIYFAKVTRLDTGGASHIVFIVRDDDGQSDLLFQTSDTTWHAYNNYGGKSLYDHQSPTGRASKVSYNRPFLDRNNDGINSFVFTTEYPMVRWLESNGYNVSYFTGVDAARLGGEILEHDVFLSVGHDEYWSGEMRTNVEAARDAGVNLAFFSGNEGFWKVRWEQSMDGTGTPYRTLVCYKESQDGAKTDPLPDVWTGTWRDMRFSPPADGGRPENALTGTIFTVNSLRHDPIHIPADDGRLRFWRNTSIAELEPGEVAMLPEGVLGYEWDEDLDNGFRPAGLINLSHTTMNVQKLWASENATYAPGTATHSLTMYRAPSGALVFGAGTVQWSWGLDGDHDKVGPVPDIRMQQATVNLFADMGVSAGSLVPGLVQTTASTDSVAPTSTITWSPTGLTLRPGDMVTIHGTAQDVGGGVVGGIEVSLDGGVTWRKATGREQWQYLWRVEESGTARIMSRATDDSLNMETPAASVEVEVPGRNPVSIFPDRAAPFTAPRADAQVDTAGGIEFGMRFRAGVDGEVTGVRFYKFLQNKGVHTGKLWTTSGQLLAQARFTNETDAGWQTVRFSVPVPIQANQTYIVSYHTTDDYYADDWFYFADKGIDNGPLHALTAGVDGPNGTYKYGPGGFPSDTYRSSNYYVDPLFVATEEGTAPRILSRTPAASAVEVPTSTAISVVFDEPINPATALLSLTDDAGETIGGSLSYEASTRTLLLIPSETLVFSSVYTVVVSGVEDQDGNVADPETWSFTTAAVDITPPTIVLRTPYENAVGVSVTSPIVVKFSEAIDPQTVLLSLSHAGETLPGAQSYEPLTHTLTFQPNAPFSSVGSYLVTLSGARDMAGNVMVPVNWMFSTEDSVGPTVVARTPDAGLTNVSVLTSVTATFNELIHPSTASFLLLKPDGSQVPGMTSYNSLTGVLLMQPISVLSDNTTYMVTLSGVRDAADNTMTPMSWSFTTGANPSAERSVYSIALNPNAPTTIDPATITAGGVELGMRFRADVSGHVLGIRYFRGSGNGGTHVGSLWSSGQQLLAQATFVNETATGWQTVYFSEPTPIQAGQTYVVSYHTTADRWVRSMDYFAYSGTDAGSLHALKSGVDGGNGVYAYAGTSTFPGETFRSSNYWVDVLFQEGAVADTLPPALSDSGPAAGAIEVPVNTAITATFSEVIDGGSLVVTLQGPGGVIAGVTTYDGASRRLTYQPSSVLARGTTYTVTVSGATDLAGNVMVPATWSFTTVAPTTGEISVWGVGQPSGGSIADPPTLSSGGANLGTKFRSDVDGYVLGVEFFKPVGNTGTHTGSLWDANGQLLAQATFVNETASGWQKVYFSMPVLVHAGQTYTVSYHTTTDYWFRAQGYFTGAGADFGPLHALADGVDGGNGVYLYGSTSQMPVNSYRGTNYWVDVLFTEDQLDLVAPTVIAQTPYANALHVAVNSSVSATFSEAVDLSAATMTLTPRYGVAMTGVLRYTESTRTWSFRPSTLMAYGSTYTVTVSGVKDLAGNVMAPVTWTFKTKPLSVTLPSLDKVRGVATQVVSVLTRIVEDLIQRYRDAR